jgi:hypothetical protein
VAVAAAIPKPLAKLCNTLAGLAGHGPAWAPEASDWAVWASALLATVGVFVGLQRRRQRAQLGQHRVRLTLVIAALAAAIIGISAVRPETRGVIVNVSWFGFGVPVCLATLALIPLTSRFVHAPHPGFVRYLSAIAAVITTVWYLPTLIQPSWGLIDSYHSGYVINDILAPAAGKLPLSGFVHQYTSLMGLPVLPLLKLAGTGHR